MVRQIVLSLLLLAHTHFVLGQDKYLCSMSNQGASDAPPTGQILVVEGDKATTRYLNPNPGDGTLWAVVEDNDRRLVLARGGQLTDSDFARISLLRKSDGKYREVGISTLYDKKDASFEWGHCIADPD